MRRHRPKNIDGRYGASTTPASDECQFPLKRDDECCEEIGIVNQNIPLPFRQSPEFSLRTSNALTAANLKTKSRHDHSLKACNRVFAEGCSYYVVA